jgi:hypothetical protein
MYKFLHYRRWYYSRVDQSRPLSRPHTRTKHHPFFSTDDTLVLAKSSTTASNVIDCHLGQIPKTFKYVFSHHLLFKKTFYPSSNWLIFVLQWIYVDVSVNIVKIKCWKVELKLGMGGTLSDSEWHLPFLSFILHFSLAKGPLCIDYAPSDLIQERRNLSVCQVKVIIHVVIYLFNYTSIHLGSEPSSTGWVSGCIKPAPEFKSSRTRIKVPI